MDAFRIVGGQPLSGTIAVRGAKNAALPILATALLTDEPCTFDNVPQLSDVRTQVAILRELGIDIEWQTGGEDNLEDGGNEQAVPRRITTRLNDDGPVTAPYDLVRQMRASILVLGPLLAKRGKAVVSLPGGCVIGERPVDLHLHGLRALGADFRFEHGYLHGQAPAGGLVGAEIYLGGKFGSSVTATHNVMCAATLAKGTTTIECAACEPEVVDLANCLIAMGAKISGAGSPRIIIEGVESLAGAHHPIMADRIEAATMLALGAITRSPLTVTGCDAEHMLAVLHVFNQMGITVDRGPQSMTVRPPERPSTCDVVTLPFPAFPTDCQAQLMAIAAISSGTSVITERIYPERFMHAAELKRMGANIKVSQGQAVVEGVKQLQGSEVMASDLRASAGLVIAAAAAEGETTIRRIYHIDRGYEHIDQRLRDIGVNIERFTE